MTHKRYAKFDKKNIEHYIHYQKQGQFKVKVDGEIQAGDFVTCKIEEEDLGEIQTVYVSGSLPISYSTYEKMYSWMKLKTPYDDLHEFYMNLPWPYPKNIDYKWPEWETYNRVHNFEQEYLCKFHKTPEQYTSELNPSPTGIPMLDIHKILFGEPEDELLPGNEITFQEYEIPIPTKYWGVDLGGLHRDDYSISEFSAKVLDGSPAFDLKYIEEGDYWVKPLKVPELSKTQKIILAHQDYMKAFRKYKKLIKDEYGTPAHYIYPGCTVSETTSMKKEGFFWKLTHRKQEWD